MADEYAAVAAPPPAETPPGDESWEAWLARIAASRKKRDDRIAEWQENVETRKGDSGRSPSSLDSRNRSDGSRISVNQDWPLTKAKIAQLYSVTPEVRLTPRREQFRAAVPIFAQELNMTIDDASVGSTIEECLADVVNAAGIGAVMVSCEARTEMRQVPAIDPATLPPDVMMAVQRGEFQLPTTSVETPVDRRYLVQRISPADLLVPDDFTGSNYDQARWLGEDGRMTWAQAVNELRLTDDVKDKVLGTDQRAGGTSHSLNTDTSSFRDTDVVNYVQVFYWRHFYHPEETNFKAIQRVVFVDGLDAPVINEEYKGQQRQGSVIVGVTKNPIRVLTLTYISDEGLPPSDSSISRYQVDELEASRDAMVQQRRHSIPIRWFNPSTVGPAARSLLEKGTFQGFIPVANGERGIGEVARASFPQERFEFDRIIKNDLTEIWQVGTNQTGAFASGERSAREAGIIERNFQRRVGQEQDKVSKFFLGIAEVLAGHLALYGNFDLPDELGPQRQQIANAFAYSVRVDSTVRIDAEQRIEQLTRALNLTAQSGHIDPSPAIAEIWELSGMDPAKVMIKPKEKGPEPIKISINSWEDLQSQLFMAMLVHTNQAPTPEDMTAALKIQQAAVQPTMPGSIVPPGVPPPPPPGGGPPGPGGEVETPPIANASWEAAPRLDRRDEDGGAGGAP